MHRIKGTLLVIFIAIASQVTAQSELRVYGAPSEMYLKHTVIPKETWYSLGRLYNLSPKEITAYNNTSLEEVLKIDQEIKIPLINYNFSQDGVREIDEVFVPVYYVVQDKEWLYRVSVNNNKVPVEALEKWNNITNDDVRPGMKLVVGYLKVKSSQSDLASKGTKRITVVTAAPPVAKNDPPQETRTMEKRESTPVTTTSNTTRAVTEQPAGRQPKETAAPVTETVEQSTYTGYRGGYFKNGFNGNGKNITGNAGVFRSTSGWKDGKYYALMNNVPVGTIIKVTFSSTNKTVYAKVLGQLPDMKESAGLTIRISDAAAAELGAELGKFYVDVHY